MDMLGFSVRYIVADADEALLFYTRYLGLHVDIHPNSHFAILSRGGLRLMLSTSTGPGGGAQPMPDGRRPEPGGWNRIQIQVRDLATEVQSLRQAGVRFRSDVITGIGAKQILLDDPSGNPIELYELLSDK